VGTEWILGSFHNVNEAFSRFRRENGYLGGDFAPLTKPPAQADMLGLVGAETWLVRLHDLHGLAGTGLIAPKWG
jgi:hypothetical protein